jgi:hypothetical protein
MGKDRACLPRGVYRRLTASDRHSAPRRSFSASISPDRRRACRFPSSAFLFPCVKKDQHDRHVGLRGGKQGANKKAGYRGKAYDLHPAMPESGVPLPWIIWRRRGNGVHNGR